MQDVSIVVWTAVMMGLEEEWKDVIAALARRMTILESSGQHAANSSNVAAVRQLFHVRSPCILQVASLDDFLIMAYDG